MMRVTYVIDNLLYGGAQRDLGQLATDFATRGHRQSVFCLNQADADILRIFASAGVAVSRSSPLEVASGATLLKLIRHLRRDRTDLIMTILPVSDAVGRLAGRLAGVPRVCSMILGHKAGWELRLNRPTARWVHQAFINTERLRAYTVEREGIPNERLLTIDNGVDLASFDPATREAARAELGLGEGDLALACTGRLSPEKGQDILLEAMERLAPSHPSLRLFLMGEGPLRPQLERSIDAAGLRERVRLLGNRRDVPRLLPAFDLYAQPSRHEGMPNALLEAMAAGLPCVASRVGGVVDVVLEGETGFLVDPERPADLADALNRFLRSPTARAAMGRAGRDRVETRFSLPRMLKSYHEALLALFPSP